jgi:hypothetical protein
MIAMDEAYAPAMLDSKPVEMAANDSDRGSHRNPVPDVVAHPRQ